MSNLSRNEKYSIISDSLMHMLLEPKYAFISPIGIGLKLAIDTGVTDVAATDGVSLFVEDPFFDYDPKYRVPILAHEMLHVFLGHTMRRGERDPFLWNAAGDFIVNDNVIRTFHEDLPPGVLYDKKYEDWATEQVYESLEFDQKLKDKLMDDVLDNAREIEKKNQQGKPGQGGKPGQQPGQGQPVPGGAGRPKPGERGMREVPGGGAEPGKEMVKGGFNGKDVFETPPDKQGEVMERIRDGYTKGYGNLPGSIRDYMRQWLYPELPWETLLARFYDQVVKENYRFGPFRKSSIYQKTYLPTMYEEEIKVAVAIDTSGSVGDEMVGKFLNEVRAISELNGVTGYMIPVAMQIDHVFEYPPFPTNREIDEYIKTGGTDFRPPFKYIADELDDDINAMVYLTDGEGPYPEQAPPYPVLWVLSVHHEPGTTYYPPFGEVIYLPSTEKS